MGVQGQSRRTGERFKIFCPVRILKKAGADGSPPKMTVEGIISSDRRDLQDERVIQKGLDFDYFLGQRGTFNNEHLPGHHNVLGIPKKVQRYDKGEILPNGQVAERPCTWASGVLLNEPDAIKTYQKARALQEHGRGLAFSIEGKILRRAGPRGDIIAQAQVHHVAICHEPVNPDAQMDTLYRSLKAASMTAAIRRTTSRRRTAMLAGPQTPGGPDNPLVRQDLEPRIANLAGSSGKKRRKKGPRGVKGQVAKKSLQAPNIVQSVRAALPHVGVAYAVLLAAELDRQP